MDEFSRRSRACYSHVVLIEPEEDLISKIIAETEDKLKELISKDISTI
jgi:hypothetical protein